MKKKKRPPPRPARNKLNTFVVRHCYIDIATHHVDHRIKVIYQRAAKMYEIRKQKLEDASSQRGAYVVEDKHKVQTKKVSVREGHRGKYQREEACKREDPARSPGETKRRVAPQRACITVARLITVSCSIIHTPDHPAACLDVLRTHSPRE